ncbi:hypothetical protein V1478_003183, partial [Vespula squamosa]
MKRKLSKIIPSASFDKKKFWDRPLETDNYKRRLLNVTFSSVSNIMYHRYVHRIMQFSVARFVEEKAC